MKRAQRARRLCIVLLFAGCLAQETGTPRTRTRVVDCMGGYDHAHCGWGERPCGSIQAALDKSKNGDRIEVKPGVCRGKGNYELQFRGLELELIGMGWTRATGPAVEITCENRGRALKFEHSEGVRSVVQGFVVRDCQADYGGGVWCSNASPILERMVFRNNKAGFAGGAIYWSTRGPVLKDVAFEHNEAGFYGADEASDAAELSVPGFPLEEYNSGEDFPQPGLEAHLVDHYGNIVTTTYDTTISIRIKQDAASEAPLAKKPKKNQVLAGAFATGAPGTPGQTYAQVLAGIRNPEAGAWVGSPEPSRLEGSTQVPVVAGISHWKDLKVFAKPGSRVVLALSQEEEEVEVEVEVGVRHCVLGEEDLDLGCAFCPPGTI
jgi:predicted outer membrane repeat protein